MSEIPDDPLARAQVQADMARLEATLANEPTITREELLWHQAVLVGTRNRANYFTSRSRAEVAIKLGVSATRLTKVLHGQRILDIGCGTGTFAAQVARDKSIYVTALDNASNALGKIPLLSNLTAVEGDGYDLAASGLEPDSFDSVFVTYSTSFWALTEEEVEKSISQPLKFLRSGGSLFYTPAAQDVGVTEADLNGLMPKRYNAELRAIHPAGYNKYLKVRGLFALQRLQLIKRLEDSGYIRVAFRASYKNASFNKMDLGEGRLVSPDSYSAIMTVEKST